MTAKYTEATTYSASVSTELNSLADDTAALATTAISNDASTERQLLGNFKITIASITTGATSPQVHLLIVPDDGTGTFSDTTTVETAGNHIARYADGTDVTFDLDVSAAAGYTFIATGVQIPNANYKPGLLNQADAALAATGNTIEVSGTYSIDDV